MKAGWQAKELGDICDLQNGYAFQSNDYIEYSNTLNIRMSNIRPDGNFDPEHNQRFLPDEFVNKFSPFLLKVGDLIIAMTDMAGEPKILGLPTLVENLGGRNFLMNQRVGKLYGFSSDIYIPYLRYFLSSPDVKQYYKDKGAGGLQINISKSDVLSVTVPVPNISEQQRIVTILDEAFEGIDTATANAKKNLANARELFDSEMQAVFTECSATWSMHTLKEMSLVFGRGKSKHRPRNDPKLYGGSYPFIQTGNIRNAGHIVMDYTQTYNELGLAQSKLWSKGTLCITIAANIAETAILGFDSCFPDSVIGFVADPTKSDVHFVEYLLTSFKERLQAKGKGSAQDNLNLATFEGERFPFPSVIEQKIITAQLDELSTETKKLEAIYQQKLTALEELKKSILNQAFSGQLN